MFRFTIRELVLLTVIVGVVAAWFVDRQRMQRRMAEVAHQRDAFEGKLDALVGLVETREGEVEFRRDSVLLYFMPGHAGWSSASIEPARLNRLKAGLQHRRP